MRILSIVIGSTGLIEPDPVTFLSIGKEIDELIQLEIVDILL